MQIRPFADGNGKTPNTWYFADVDHVMRILAYVSPDSACRENRKPVKRFTSTLRKLAGAWARLSSPNALRHRQLLASSFVRRRPVPAADPSPIPSAASDYC